MGKQGEIDYAALIGDGGRQHAAGKPFSDPGRGRYLQQLGTILELLDDPPQRVLDMGCGTGWTSDFLNRSGYEVVGVDIAPDMIELARSGVDRDGLRFEVRDYEQLGDLGSFDAVLFFDSLHHAEDERQALTAAHDSLTTDGMVVLNEPGLGHHLTTESITAMEQYGVTEKEMPASRIIDLAREIGFKRWKVVPDPNQLINLFSQSPEDAGIEHRLEALKRLVAAPVVRILGGRPESFADDLSDFAFLKLVNAFVQGVSTQGAITVLYA